MRNWVNPFVLLVHIPYDQPKTCHSACQGLKTGSQGRMDHPRNPEKATAQFKRAQNDYLVNLNAELELRQLHDKLDHQMVHQWRRLLEIQQIQIDLLQQLRQ